MAPKAPIGATFMMMAMTPNTAARPRRHVTQAVAALAQAHQRKAEQNRKQQHLQDIAVGKAPTTLSGMMCRTKSTDFCDSRLLGVGGDRLPHRRDAPKPRPDLQSNCP